MAAAGSQDAVAAAQRFDAAHRALIDDSSVQFALQPADPPPQPPQWLLDFVEWLGRVLAPVGRFFGWIGSFLPDAPYARILLWSVLAIAAASLLWLVVQRFRTGEWRWPRLRRGGGTAGDAAQEEWAPDEAPARAWLREADMLAEQGRFAEAVHHLLQRCIDDIARRRPRLVRPALTSRDLAAARDIPAGARTIFAGIAAVVERSLFGGRPVGPADWARCRAAYAEFIVPKMWHDRTVAAAA